MTAAGKEKVEITFKWLNRVLLSIIGAGMLFIGNQFAGTIRTAQADIAQLKEKKVDREEMQRAVTDKFDTIIMILREHDRTERSLMRKYRKEHDEYSWTSPRH